MAEYIFNIDQVLYDDDTKSLVAKPEYVGELIRCKDCRWGRKTCGNIECFVDGNIPEYHGYEWFCPNGERKSDE